jgi:HK97 family phage major capsid protein
MTTQKFSGTNGDSVWTDAQNDLPGFGRLGGYRSAVSNIVPNNLTKGSGTNLSSIIFGNWSDIVVGNWGGMYVQVDPYSAHSRSLVQIYVEMLMDINIRNEESFAAIIDAVTTI